MDAFYALALLACPVGMGAMMWFMSRGRGSKKQPSVPTMSHETDAAFGADPRQQEIDALRHELDLRSADALRSPRVALRKGELR